MAGVQTPVVMLPRYSLEASPRSCPLFVGEAVPPWRDAPTKGRRRAVGADVGAAGRARWAREGGVTSATWPSVRGGSARGTVTPRSARRAVGPSLR
jgi:hypothetical protein